jgi:hypothetical protein
MRSDWTHPAGIVSRLRAARARRRLRILLRNLEWAEQARTTPSTEFWLEHHDDSRPDARQGCR